MRIKFNHQSLPSYFFPLIFSILMMGTQSVCGQSERDSLWTIWEDVSLPDSSRLKAMKTISWNVMYSHPDSAFYFAQLKYDYAKSKGLKQQMANALQFQGISLYQRSEYDSAIEYYSRSLSIFEEIGRIQGVASVLNNMGNVYLEKGDYDSCIYYLEQGLAKFKEVGDDHGVASALTNIGNIYKNQSVFSKAIDYYTRALKYHEAIGNKEGVANTLSNIGSIYVRQGDTERAIDYFTQCYEIYDELGSKSGIANALNSLGSAYHKQGDLVKTIDYYTRCLRICEEMGSKLRVAITLGNLGSTYVDMGDLDLAIDHYARSLAISEEIGDQLGVAICYTGLGSIYLDRGDYGSAISYGKQALTIAKNIGAQNETNQAAELLYKSYKAIGSYQPALEMHELHKTTGDSIDSEENQREVIRQEFKYNYEKKAVADSIAFAKEQQIKDVQLENSRTRQYALIGGLMIVLIFFVIIYNRLVVIRKQKAVIDDKNKEINATLEDLKISQSQMIRSEKMASLGKLTAGIAHEINNPVSFTRTSSFTLDRDLKELMQLVNTYKKYLNEQKQQAKKLEELEKTVDLDELLHEIDLAITNIKEGTKRTSDIVKELTEFSYQDRDQMQPADIHNGIDSTLMLLKSKIVPDVEVVKNYDSSLKEINCHIGQLNQVFMNIISNSVDAIEGKGELKITTKDQGKSILISIEDNGKGISEDNINKIFDPFFTTKKIGEGTGLGLSISHTIINEHKGNIEVESFIDKGTRIDIELPKK